jgi:2-polyprenyl-6-methoxyphenol hydroxylase-like FAD-dependent oxidoreductase
LRRRRAGGGDFLSEGGHEVTIFERFAEPRPLGAGLLLQPTGLAVLRALGLEQSALAQGARVVVAARST